MRILILEDDSSVAKLIALTLKAENMACDIVGSGKEGLEIASLYNYDLIILDLMLPDINGYEVLQNLRRSKQSIPILILSGLGESAQKVKGLGYGADDYLTKPFDKEELIARVKAIIRRSRGHADSSIIVGELKVDIDKHITTYASEAVKLTSKEQTVLEALALKKGQVINKESLLDYLYNGMEEPELKIIDVFVCKVRKKLADISGGINYIDTVWGRGYKLKDIGDISDEKAS